MFKRYWQKTLFKHGVTSIRIGNYSGQKHFLKAYRLIGAYFVWIGLNGYELKVTIPKLSYLRRGLKRRKGYE